MPELSCVSNYIPAMSVESIEKVQKLEGYVIDRPQVDVGTSHVIHAGMYARTIMIPAGVMLTGAFIKIATILIIHGDVVVYTGDQAVTLNGYNVLSASANRKQAFIAKTDTYITMVFPSDSESVKEAEEEFTNETHMLLSRHHTASNKITITGGR